MVPYFFCRYGNLYTENNVAISGIHTHAGPGGYLQYVVYIVTSLGFVRQSFDVIVDGIEQSIIQAHENLRPGSIFVNKGNEKDSLLSLIWAAVTSPSLCPPPPLTSKFKAHDQERLSILIFNHKIIMKGYKIKL